MQDIYKTAKLISNDLDKNKSKLQPKQRIILRNQVNLELGIYKKEFSIFKIV